MNRNHRLAAALLAAALFVAGCGKKEEAPAPTPPPPPAPATPPSSSTAPANPVATAKEVATKAEEQAKSTVQSVTTAAQETAKAVTDEVNAMITKAKGLAGENKLEEALGLVNQLLQKKLSPEQQGLVDTLKTQIEDQIKKAAAAKATSEATKAVGGLLKKK